MMCATSPARSQQHEPDTVRVGAYILSIHDLNFHDREYTIRFWVWMRYSDTTLHFERRVEVPNAKSVEKPDTITEITESEKLTGRKDSILVTMKMKCIMKEDWDVDAFPFDRESLEVHVENSAYDNTAFVFMKDSAGEYYDKNDPPLQGWGRPHVWTTVENHRYPTTFGELPESTYASDYSRFIIHIVIEREPLGLFLKLFLGMYVAFFISFIGFLIPIDNSNPRFEIPIGGLLAVVGNKYIIEPLLPEASAFTIVDMLHILTLASILAMIGVSVKVLWEQKQHHIDAALRWNNRGRNWIVSVYVVVNMAVIVFSWYFK